MYLKIKKKKIKIYELTNFWDRLKGLKFVLEPIDYGLKFPKKKFTTTIFLCQKIDIILTTKDEKIVYLYENMSPEKYIFPKKEVYNTYFLPQKTACNFKIGDKLPIILPKNK